MKIGRMFKARYLVLVTMGAANLLLFQNCSNYSGQVAIDQIDGLMANKGDISQIGLLPGGNDLVDDGTCLENCGSPQPSDDGASLTGDPSVAVAVPADDSIIAVADPAVDSNVAVDSSAGDSSVAVTNPAGAGDSDEQERSIVTAVTEKEDDDGDSDEQERSIVTAVTEKESGDGDSDEQERPVVAAPVPVVAAPAVNDINQNCAKWFAVPKNIPSDAELIDINTDARRSFDKKVVILSSARSQIEIEELALKPGSTVCGDIHVGKIEKAQGNGLGNSTGPLTIMHASVDRLEHSGQIYIKQLIMNNHQPSLLNLPSPKPGNNALSIDLNGSITKLAN